MRPDFDAVLVGGGLAGGLTALALLARRPGLRLSLVEQGAQLGGNHTWCFHARDVPDAARALVDPLVVARWSGYSVRFPGRTRRLSSSYGCITSARLHEVVRERVAASDGSALLLQRRVSELGPHSVRLADGSTLRAGFVVDARGPEARVDEGTGFQKFVGLEVTVTGAEPPREPVLFDACIAQYDGFRFMYLLPFSPERLLVEETFFSDRPDLDEAKSTAAIEDYLAQRGLRVTAVLRKERGVLPMPWREAPPPAESLAAGYRGGLFHPVTGYSIPLAIRYALALAESDAPLAPDSPLARFLESHAAQRPYLRLLTRMLFTCFAPDVRYGVLEHFYRLPEPLIERFYAADLTGWDRARIFLGAPPRGFSTARALREIRALGALT